MIFVPSNGHRQIWKKHVLPGCRRLQRRHAYKQGEPVSQSSQVFAEKIQRWQIANCWEELKGEGDAFLKPQRCSSSDEGLECREIAFQITDSERLPVGLSRGCISRNEDLFSIAQHHQWRAGPGSI